MTNVTAEKSFVNSIIGFCNDKRLGYKVSGTLIKVSSGQRSVLIKILPSYFSPKNIVVVTEHNEVKNVSMLEVRQILTSFA